MKTALCQKKFKQTVKQRTLLHTSQSEAEAEYYGTSTDHGI